MLESLRQYSLLFSAKFICFYKELVFDLTSVKLITGMNVSPCLFLRRVLKEKYKVTKDTEEHESLQSWPRKVVFF